PEAQGFLLGDLLFLGQLVLAHLGRARGVFLEQRMTWPGGWHQDARGVRMSIEAYAEHVPRFALVPVRRGPQGNDAGHARRFTRQRDLDAQIRIALERGEVIDEGEAALRLALTVDALAFVDDGEVVEKLVRLRNFGL